MRGCQGPSHQENHLCPVLAVPRRLCCSVLVWPCSLQGAGHTRFAGSAPLCGISACFSIQRLSQHVWAATLAVWVELLTRLCQVRRHVIESSLCIFNAALSAKRDRKMKRRHATGEGQDFSHSLCFLGQWISSQHHIYWCCKSRTFTSPSLAVCYGIKRGSMLKQMARRAPLLKAGRLTKQNPTFSCALSFISFHRDDLCGHVYI